MGYEAAEKGVFSLHAHKTLSSYSHWPISPNDHGLVGLTTCRPTVLLANGLVGPVSSNRTFRTSPIRDSNRALKPSRCLMPLTSISNFNFEYPDWEAVEPSHIQISLSVPITHGKRRPSHFRQWFFRVSKILTPQSKAKTKK